MSEPIIGIDLGTTNSCVAVVRDGVPTVIPNRGGYKTTPSIVAITDKGRRLVGQLAKRQAVTNAEHTAFAIKRFIGRTFDSDGVQLALPSLPYKLVEGPNHDVRIVLHEQSLSLQEVSAMILSELKRVAEDSLGVPVSKAVITCPAYFNDNQRQATKDAGRIAGLEVVRVLNEPTAAALAYGLGKTADKTIAVYDLGGGTFDISILRITAGSFEVLASSGDTMLGGEDFDQRIMDWLIFEFAKENRIDLRQDKMALQRLKDGAEKAKTELSSMNETMVQIPFIATHAQKGPLSLERRITRSKLEELTADLVERTIETCRMTLEEAELGPGEIEDVILVGGMTRVPRVQETVTSFFGRPPSRNVHPDEVVALGAALHGASVDSGKAERVLRDVTPHSLGIMVAGGQSHRLIERNSAIPISAQHVFTTTRDDQTSMQIVVVQGEGEVAEDNEQLGLFTLTDLRAGLRGEVEVEVSFDINADGIVKVQARDLDTGQSQHMEITGRSGLSEDEIQDMTRANRDAQGADRGAEDVEKGRLRLRHLVGEAEQVLPRVARAMARIGIDWNALGQAQSLVDDASRIVESGDPAAVARTTSALAELLARFRAKLGG